MSKVKCAYCKDFIDKDAAVRRSIQSFCNDGHQRAYATGTKLSTRPDKPPKKKARKEDIPAKTRKAVLAADGKKCRFCGQRKWGQLQIHHVVYRGQVKGIMEGDHQKHNLLTLCKEHHDTVHSDKKKWQKICLALLWLREVEGDKVTLLPGVLQALQRMVVTPKQPDPLEDLHGSHYGRNPRSSYIERGGRAPDGGAPPVARSTIPDLPMKTTPTVRMTAHEIEDDDIWKSIDKIESLTISGWNLVEQKKPIRLSG